MARGVSCLEHPWPYGQLCYGGQVSFRYACKGITGTALRTGNVKIGFPFTVHGNQAALRAASLLAQAGHRFAARIVVQPSETWHELTNQPTTTPINDKD
jgi:hypothetical protein